jgi:hypothetical protein
LLLSSFDFQDFGSTQPAHVDLSSEVMSRPSSDNTTSSHNTSNTQKAVFNYAQAARKSSPTSAQASANGNQAPTPPVNGGVKQPQQQQQPQASSFAAALQKSSNPYVVPANI